MTKDVMGMNIWTGGDCPVSPDEIVNVRLQGGLPRDATAAGNWPQVCWRHRHMDDPKSVWNIIAYGVVRK